MIHQRTIDRIEEEVSIVDVVDRIGRIKLTKKGKDFWGTCPFHREKTDSFSVSPAKGFYKCFGCGAGGGTVNFVMKTQNLDFPNAIERIANTFNIEVEHDNSDRAVAYMAVAKKLEDATVINELALATWQAQPINEIGAKAIADRWADPAPIIDQWEITYAPNAYDTLKNAFTTANVKMDVAQEMGLVKHKEDSTHLYDKWRNRIMFPIRDHRDKLIGFGGRHVDGLVADEGKKIAKYINSDDLMGVYEKKKVLYGIHIAKKAIQLTGSATLVEGYTDVIAMHVAGHVDAVGCCGTAFTDEHARLLRKFGCRHLDIALDGDAAGRTAAKKAAMVCLENGLSSQFIIFPDNEDPDSLLKKHNYPQEWDALGVTMMDAVEWMLEGIWVQASNSSGKVQAEKETIELLSHIKDDMTRKVYSDHVKKNFKPSSDVFRAATTVNAATLVEDMDDAPSILPPGVNRHKLMEHGLDIVADEKKNRFAIFVRNGKNCYEVSNFSISPLFHIFNLKDDRNKRICVIRNGIDRFTIEISSKQLGSMPEFNVLMCNHGNFNFTGVATDLAKLKGYLIAQFPRAVEIFWHGWQPEGFFAFADGIHRPTLGFQHANENGLAMVDKGYWFLPACSNIYEGRRDDNQDDYQEMRPLRYRSQKVGYDAFAAQFMKVFGEEKGAWGIGWAMMAAFRELVFNELNSFFPHLYTYGETQSGKSTFCMAINGLWYHNRPAFQLSNGTAPGLAAYMANITNAVAWCDEMDYGLDRNIFQQVKSAADGTGRLKRSQSTTRQSIDRDKVNSAVLLSGQYLVTEDTGSLINRSILLEFRTLSYTPQQMIDKELLDTMVEGGLSDVLCQILDCRPLMEKRFAQRYRELNAEMRGRMDKKGVTFTNRTMQVMMSVVAAVDVMRERIQHPTTHAKMMDMAEEKISSMGETVSTTNAMSTFWRIMEQQYQIVTGKDENGIPMRGVNEGTDFIISPMAANSTLKLQIGKNKFETITLKKSEKILFIRLGNVHGKYLREHKAQFGSNGIGDTDLRSYMKSTEGFIGNVMLVPFGKIRTTAIAFRWELLTREVTFGTPREDEEQAAKDELRMRAEKAAQKAGQLPTETSTPAPTDIDSNIEDDSDDDLPF